MSLRNNTNGLQISREFCSPLFVDNQMFMFLKINYYWAKNVIF